MEIEQLRKELNHLLENIVNHSSNFSEGRQIPSLEIGVVLAKINKMQEKLIVLRHLIETGERNRKKAKKIKVKEETAESVIENKEIVEEHVSEEPVVIAQNEIPEEEVISENIETSSSVADQIQQAPINKLVDAFTLNDRYLYANELFNKDMSAFNETIKAIDNCNSIDEAQTLFNQTGVTYNWDVENQLVADFMSLIERRFS